MLEAHEHRLRNHFACTPLGLNNRLYSRTVTVFNNGSVGMARIGWTNLFPSQFLPLTTTRSYNILLASKKRRPVQSCPQGGIPHGPSRPQQVRPVCSSEHDPPPLFALTRFESFTRTPEPPLISRWTRPLQRGHLVTGASDMDCFFSNRYPHLSHSYSYVGITLTP